MTQDLLSDIASLRQTNKAASIDISEIVSKHIVPGKSRAELEVLLSSQNFSLHPQPQAPDGTWTLLAIHRPENKVMHLGFHDEIRVNIVFQDAVAVSGSGKLIYRAL